MRIWSQYVADSLTAFSSASYRSKKLRKRFGERRAFFEQLEQRDLLAVIWRNPLNAVDVNADGFTVPLDALNVINDLNANGPRQLPEEKDADLPFLDTDGDQFVAPGDVLRVINALNAGNVSPFQLTEGNTLAREATATITLGQAIGSRVYRLQIDAAFDNAQSESVLADVFAVYLVNPTDRSETLLDRGTPGTSLFTLTDGRAEFQPGIVRWDGSVLEIDVSQLANRDTGVLKLQLLSADDDTGTRITVRPLTNEVDPEGIPPQTFPASSDPTLPGEELATNDLEPLSTLKAEVHNVRFDSESGRLAAEVQLRNEGTSIGRAIAVAFPGLPTGVTLHNASGEQEGVPFINWQPAIPLGGLQAGDRSQPMLVELDDPTNTRFNLAPEVLGAQNRAPSLESLGPLNVLPGGVLSVPLNATDPDGDQLVFSLNAARGLPNVTLSADGIVTFRPTPTDIGSFPFSVNVSDGAAQATQSATLNVSADPRTTTRITGVVLETNGQPLANMAVEVGAIQGLTAADGSFTLDLGADSPVGDTLKIRGELFPGAVAFPFIAEKLPFLLQHNVFPNVNNVIGRPIFLPPLDVANGQDINPSQDTTVTTPAISGASVLVKAGTLMNQQGTPFDGVLSITKVPTDLTPAALPNTLFPDLVVTIQPGEMVFAAPAPLSLPNSAGFSAGELLDLWSINPTTGEFENVGTGQVSSNGQVINTTSGGIRNSSWHFFAPPPPPAAENPANNNKNQNKQCNECETLAQPSSTAATGGTGRISPPSDGSFGYPVFTPRAARELRTVSPSAIATSDVELHSGALREMHGLATYKSLGAERGLALMYNSERADPRPIIHFAIDNAAGGATDRLVARMSFTRGGVTHQVPGFAGGQFGLSGGEHFWKLPGGRNRVEAALQPDLRDHPSGQYDFEISFGIRRFNGQVFAGTDSQFQTQDIVVNRATSPFGAGWDLAGLQEIVLNDDGSALLIDGDGSESLFEAPATAGQPFQSPPGDFTILERLADGTFRRTFKDQTIIRFNANNQIASITDRNGNQIVYAYDAEGRLVNITDPVGLVTTFTYSDGRVTAITDPANRITKLEYDTNGNLVRITDPDDTARNFEYDGKHHLTAETNKRGLREEAVYNFAGRVIRAIRKDGTESHFDPVQTQGLFPPEQTTDRVNSPVVKVAANSALSTVADPNGNVTVSQLDQLGQATSEQDSAGQLATVTRDARNLPLRTTDGRGNNTFLTFDERGNLLTVEDDITRSIDQLATLFPSQSYLVATAEAQDVALGDLDNDNDLDVVVTQSRFTDQFGNFNGQTGVSVRLNNGNGTFGPLASFSTGSNGVQPLAVVLADVNGDGNLDFVTANQTSSTVSIGRGNGDGTFAATVNLATFSNPEDVKLADVDGDLDLDLFVAASSGVSMFTNDGTGAFGNRKDISTIPGTGMVVVDLNKDNNLDVAMSPGGRRGVRVFFGDGLGGFGPEVGLGGGSHDYQAIDAADLDNDGDFDLVAVASRNVPFNESANFTTFVNDGTGAFTATNLPEAGGEIFEDIALRDLDGDGRVDLVITAAFDDSLFIKPGNSDGTFGTRIEIPVGEFPTGLEIGDLDGNGTLDAVSSNRASSNITVLQGQRGRFFPNNQFRVGENPVHATLGDLDGDGDLDVVTANNGGRSLSVGFNDGAGRFDGRIDLPCSSSPLDVAVGDFNGDNRLDIAAVGDNQLHIFLGNDDGTFGPRVDLAIGTEVSGLELADLDADNDPDVVVHTRLGFSIFPGLGNGTFDTRVDIAFTTVRDGGDGSFVVDDLDGDGDLDLATTGEGNAIVPLRIVTLLNNGNGTFAEPAKMNVNNRRTRLTSGDLDGDDDSDLVVHVSPVRDFRGSFAQVVVLTNNGSGAFTVGTPVGLEHRESGPMAFKLADINLDDKLDLVTTGSANVLLGNGNGTFGATSSFAAGANSRSISLGDLDGDGDLDFVVPNFNGSGAANQTVTVSLNQTLGLESCGDGPCAKVFTYDPVFNQLTSATDELGHQTLFEIDPANGNMLSMTRVVGTVDAAPGGDDIVTRFTYTAQGLTDRITDPLGRVTDQDYDALGRLVRVTYALGTSDEAEIGFEYDLAGNVRAQVDELGRRSEIDHDPLNRIVQVRDPLHQDASTVYDAAGNLSTFTDERGNTTQNEYDEMDRLVRSTDPNAGEMRYAYDAFGNLATRTDELGRVVRYRYDARNRLIETVDPAGGITRSRYDAANNPIATIDQLGNRTARLFDSRNRLVAMVDPLQNVSRWHYDPADRVVQQVDPLARRTSFGYDDLDRQTRRVDALNGTSTMAYDATGNIVSLTDELGRTTRFTYDNRDRLTQSIDALNGVLAYRYDDAGNLLEHTDEIGRTSRMTYDALNRRITFADPLANTTTMGYDAASNLTQVTDPLGHITQFTYDDLNRLVNRRDALDGVITWTYDAVDQLTSITDELNRTTRFEHDLLGRRTTTIDPLDHKTRFEYDAVGNLLATIDPLGHTIRRTYDARYREIRRNHPDGSTTHITYDALDNVLNVTDPTGNSTSYTYDDLNRVIREVNTLGDARTYTYDAVDNRVSSTDRNGRTIQFTYDVLNRMTREEWLDGGANVVNQRDFTYDAAGQLLTAVEADSAYAYTYDAANRLLTVDNTGTLQVPAIVFTYAYDSASRTTSKRETINGVAGATTTLAYDDLNRLTRIEQNGTGVSPKRIDLSYDAAGQYRTIQRFADVGAPQTVAQSRYTHDLSGRLTQLAHERSTDDIAQYDFVFDAANRITQLSAADGTSDYQYDDKDQLVSADHTFQSDESYSYDASGNRTNDGFQTGLNNRVQTNGQFTYDYDAEGNRTRQTETATGNITEYEWDHHNLLTRVVFKDSAGTTVKEVRYRYDVFDRRITKEIDEDGAGPLGLRIESYVYDGMHIALTFDGSGARSHRYVHGPMIDQILADENALGQILWPLADHQGTVRDLIDSSGAVVNHLSYDSFGNVTAESNAGVGFAFGYTGREFDPETGMLYYRARYYDSAIGRFLSEDSIGFSSNDTNLYRYVENSPPNATDPSGHDRALGDYGEIIRAAEESMRKAKLEEEEEVKPYNYRGWVTIVFADSMPADIGESEHVKVQTHFKSNDTVVVRDVHKFVEVLETAQKRNIPVVETMIEAHGSRGDVTIAIYEKDGAQYAQYFGVESGRLIVRETREPKGGDLTITYEKDVTRLIKDTMKHSVLIQLISCKSAHFAEALAPFLPNTLITGFVGDIKGTYDFGLPFSLAKILNKKVFVYGDPNKKKEEARKDEAAKKAWLEAQNFDFKRHGNRF